MSQRQNQETKLTEEEMMGLQFQGSRENKEEKLGSYYKWASNPDNDKTVSDDALKGFLSKDIKLGNLGSNEVMELNAEIEMLENILRCLRPAGKDDPKHETQYVAQKAHLKSIVSSGKHGFERNAQKTQVSRREVATDNKKESGGIRSRIAGVFR